MAKKTAAKKTASKKKRTAAQKRATAKLVAMNKKKRASKKKASARTGSVSTGRRRSAAKVRGYPGGARRTNPANRATFYVIVRRDNSGVNNYLYFDGSKFVERGRVHLKGPKTYMMELAKAVADEYPTTDIFVKAQ